MKTLATLTPSLNRPPPLSLRSRMMPSAPASVSSLDLVAKLLSGTPRESEEPHVAQALGGSISDQVGKFDGLAGDIEAHLLALTVDAQADLGALLALDSVHRLIAVERPDRLAIDRIDDVPFTQTDASARASRG